MIKTIVSLVRLCICSLGIISSLSWGSVDSHVENRPDKHGIERIIALSPHAVEILFLLGAGDKIVATTKTSDYPEAAKLIPVIGGYNGIQMEKVLILNPDLVIAWEGGNKLEDISQLERLGLNVYRTKTNSLLEIASEIRKIGQLIGASERANIEAEHYLKAVADVKKTYATKQTVRFFYQLWHEPLRTMSENSWINEILSTCGGQNIFNKHMEEYPQVSVETVLLEQPDVIIIPTHKGLHSNEKQFWQAWPEIPAVKHKHIYYVDGDLLHRFSIRTLAGMDSICEHFERVRQH